MATMEQTMISIPSGRKKGGKAGARLADFDAVYRGHLRRLYAFVAYRVGDRSLAEDITAQAFEKAWRSWDKYDPDRADVTGWLFAITRNCVSDHYRRQGRQQEAPLDEASLPGGTGPEQELYERERRGRLYAALAELEEREREIISLKFGGGMKNGEIAGLLSLSESNVGTILCRSLARLNHILEDGDEND